MILRLGCPVWTICGKLPRMDVPGHVRYSGDHQWAQAREGLIRVGITDYAQDALGDVIFIGLPSIGSAVVADQPLGEVESTKSVSDLFAPVSGEVVAVNDSLEDQPELLNEDPYGEGWVCDLLPAQGSSIEGLMTAAGYRELIGGV